MGRVGGGCCRGCGWYRQGWEPGSQCGEEAAQPGWTPIPPGSRPAVEAPQTTPLLIAISSVANLEKDLGLTCSHTQSGLLGGFTDALTSHKGRIIQRIHIHSHNPSPTVCKITHAHTVTQLLPPPASRLRARMHTLPHTHTNVH